MDMRFGTWNIISLYRAGSLMTVLKELSKYVIQEYRMSDGTEMAPNLHVIWKGK
jgi:hypothetical protein